jgi:hypothetical protein
MSIKYYECVFVALVIQHAKRMRRIVLSAVASSAIPYFTTLSHKLHDFRKKKKVIEREMCWFSLQLLSEMFLILRRFQRDIITNVHRCPCKVLVIHVRFESNLSFLHKFSKKKKPSNIKFNENPYSGSWVFPCRRIGGRTDRRHKANSLFSRTRLKPGWYAP